MLETGTEAPNITATTTDGNVITLADYRGRNNVVLYFYPEDDTSGCTREACEFRDARDEFTEAGAVVLGVSGDDRESHVAFSEKHHLNFPLLVDTDGVIARAFGVPVHGRQPKRVTFLIDTDGVIRRVWGKVVVNGHATDVRSAITELAQP